MNLFETMKQAHTLKKEMARHQKELAGQEFEAQSGNGSITVRINGKMEVLDVVIDPQVLQSPDAKSLQTDIRSAVNQAFSKAQASAQQAMSLMMGGMGGMGALKDLLK